MVNELESRLTGSLHFGALAKEDWVHGVFSSLQEPFSLLPTVVKI